MSKKRTEEGFPHSPDPIDGVEARIRRDGSTGDVTVAFGDGSDDLKIDRREFMRIGGVAAATAAMAGTACRSPVEKIVPYVDRPEEIRIGHPNHYATVCNACPAQCGALVQTRAGRPIKMEGNPTHPVSRGALCARGQSSYLDLYDPDRARTPMKVGRGTPSDSTWEAVDKAVKAAVASAGNIRLLTANMTGPAQLGLIEELKRGPANFEHYQYNPINSDSMVEANKIGYGSGLVPHYRFDLADIIVTLGNDFLGTWLSPVEFAKQFSSRRDPDGQMNRLVAFEGHVTLTGMNADDRYRVRPSELHLVALALANVVLVKKKSGPLAHDGAVGQAVQSFTPEAVSKQTGIPASVFEELGSELADHAGASIVVAGGSASAQMNGLALESAVNLLNAALQNEGRTIDRTRPSRQSLGGTAQLATLIKEMEAGNVDLLIIDGANPVYNAPNSGFTKALEKVKLVVNTSERLDETAALCDWLAPSGHWLEAWGDSEPIQGTYALQQPALQPLWQTRALQTSLLNWFSERVPALQTYLTVPELPPGNRPGDNFPTDSGAWYRYLRAYWESNIFPVANSLASFQRFWEDTLRTGTFQDTRRPRPVTALRTANAIKALPTTMPKARGDQNPADWTAKELIAFPTVQLYDGEQANNGHLQELPDPVTKHVWGSYAMVSPATFTANNLQQGQYLEVAAEGATHRFPVIMQPGLHDGVVAVPLGYGRSNVGVVGNEIGANAFEFSNSGAGRAAYSALKADFKALDDGEAIAIVQGAQVLDTHRRPILAQTTLEEYKANPEAGIYTHPQGPDMWGSHDYGALKWGMSIDLGKCTGCSACVTACMEENNISVVGRQGILEGREMHWMRLDRYYEIPDEALALQESVTNDPLYAKEPVVALADYMDNPRVVNQPMLCQHCEHAPCETVCPVSATMHSTDGLNQMAYNRCVGTRYCANNCPFKVRRFNWYNYATDRSDSIFARIYPEMKDHARLNIAEPLPMGFNPDVTVRARGVMEKCTFCVQRIRRAGVERRKEGRTEVRDGEVIPACQQTCPADAIVFGNLSDPESTVAKQHAAQRALSPLQEIGVHSSVAYLTSVFNTKSKGHADAGHGANEHGAESADHG